MASDMEQRVRDAQTTVCNLDGILDFYEIELCIPKL